MERASVARAGMARASWAAHALAMLLAVVTAATASAREAVSVSDLLTLSGFDSAIKDVAPSIIAGFTEGMEGELDAEETARLKPHVDAAANGAYGAARLREAMVRKLTGKITADDGDAIAAFYRGDLGKAMVAREAAAGTVEAQNEMVEKADEYFAVYDKDPMRGAVLRAIGAAVDMQAFGTTLMMNTMRGAMAGFAAADPDGPAMTKDDIEALIEQERADISVQVAQIIPLSLAYTYRDVTDEDLKAYLKFVEAPPARRFFKAAADAMEEVFKEAAYAFGEALIKRAGR